MTHGFSFQGKLLLKAKLLAETGLRIGGATERDRDRRSRQPGHPGSLERATICPGLLSEGQAPPFVGVVSGEGRGTSSSQQTRQAGLHCSLLWRL